MSRRFVFLWAATLLLCGCAIHPVPEDVTGLDTYDIVRQIRCEARETVRLELIRWLKRLADNPDPDPRAQKLTAQARDLVEQYEREPDSISSFRPDIFQGAENKRIRSVARLYFDTSIAYNFDLTMTEDNDLVADASLIRPVVQPKFTLGINAGSKRKRTNNRTFLVTDTFEHLLTRMNVKVRGVHYCDGQLAEANYVYPIAGRIGVDKLVADFINLAVFTNLADKDGKPPTMADKLTFTTALNGSVNPVAVFTPVTSALQLASISATAGVDRIDVHQVTVALAVASADVTDLISLRSYLVSSERGGAAASVRPRAAAPGPKAEIFVGNTVTGAGRTLSERLAIRAVDQLKSRELQLIPPP